MQCGRCGADLDRPGDFCLRCRTANADVVVLEVDRDRATLTMLEDETIRGTWTVTTVPEEGEGRRRQRRNYAGRIVDELRRKRPEAVYATGDRSILREVNARLATPTFHLEAEDPVASVRDGQLGADLAVVEADPAAKLGGSHSTVIGGRRGRDALLTAAAHPNVKKVVPGPIESGGSSSRTGLRASATRADARGNLRLLVRDGSSVQEHRIVTTAAERSDGERIREAINERLESAGFGG